MILTALAVFFAAGTIVALALVRGARRISLAPLPPILRIQPRELDRT